MTDKLVTSVWVLSSYADDLHACISAYGDNWKAYACIAEISYYTENGSLPEWAMFIERVEVVNDSNIFVHRDWSKAQ
jgi:hypothetical protein